MQPVLSISLRPSFLEAAFTDTPILQLCYNYPHTFPAHQDIARVLENDHLKYILNEDYPNMMHDHAELVDGLKRILSGETAPFEAYSQHLRSFADPLGIDCYKEVFLEKLKAI